MSNIIHMGNDKNRKKISKDFQTEKGNEISEHLDAVSMGAWNYIYGNYINPKNGNPKIIDTKPIVEYRKNIIKFTNGVIIVIFSLTLVGLFLLGNLMWDEILKNGDKTPFALLPFLLFSAVGVSLWKFHTAERELRHELATLFNDSFVFAYYTHYAFIRELLHHFGYTQKIDAHIDELIPSEFIKTPEDNDELRYHPKEIRKVEIKNSEKIVTEFRETHEDIDFEHLHRKYDEFREKMDESRFNAGKMLARIRIDLGDESFAEQYREYIKHARKTSYHIRRIMKNESKIKLELEPMILSLHTSDIIKMNFEKKLRVYSIHGAMLRRTVRSIQRNLAIKIFYKHFKKEEMIDITEDDYDLRLQDVKSEKRMKLWTEYRNESVEERKDTKSSFLLDFHPELHNVYCKSCQATYILIIYHGKNLKYTDFEKISKKEAGKIKQECKNHELTMFSNS